MNKKQTIGKSEAAKQAPTHRKVARLLGMDGLQNGLGTLRNSGKMGKTSSIPRDGSANRDAIIKCRRERSVVASYRQSKRVRMK